MKRLKLTKKELKALDTLVIIEIHRMSKDEEYFKKELETLRKLKEKIEEQLW